MSQLIINLVLRSILLGLIWEVFIIVSARDNLIEENVEKNTFEGEEEEIGNDKPKRKTKVIDEDYSDSSNPDKKFQKFDALAQAVKVNNKYRRKSVRLSGMSNPRRSVQQGNPNLPFPFDPEALGIS